MKDMHRIRETYHTLSSRHKPLTLLIALLAILLVATMLTRAILSLAFGGRTIPHVSMVIRDGASLRIPEHSPLREHLTTATVNVSNHPHIVTFPGIVEAMPRFTVNVLPPLSGRLTALNASLGDRVEKGAVLATLRSPDLAEAHADADKAASILALAEKNLRRIESVNRAGGNSLKDVQQAQSNLAQATVEADRAKARLQALGKNRFSALDIKAPVAGRITALNYGEGSWITDTTQPLLTISNISRIWVTANIPENLAGTITPNQSVSVDFPAYPGHVLSGHVGFVNAFLEPDTRRNKTRITFDNPNDKLQPNMFARVHIDIPHAECIMVPLSAILMNDDHITVFVETAPWVFEQRPVITGSEDGDAVRIRSGLKPGDRIVVNGGILLND